MEEYIINLIGSFGYFGMFIAMVLEAVIIIIPSELILATGGILASSGKFSLLGAFIIGLIGSVFCAIVIYVMGYYGGRKFIIKYGKFFFMKQKDIDKSDKWFEKYGMRAAFICRFFPIVRTFISLPIGISKLNFKKFVIYTTLGSIPWTLIFVLSGYYLGNNYTKIASIFNMFKLPIIIFLIICVLAYLYIKIIKPKIIFFKLKNKKE